MSSPNFIESLENRMLLSVSLGKNLIVNGDAESGMGTSDGGDIETIPGWTQGDPSKPATVVLYGAAGSFPTATSIGPANRGDQFFAGGNGNDASTLNQNIDLRSLATDIDAGRIQITLSGYFGGTGSEDDTPILQGIFSDANDRSIDTPIQTGSVSAADRGDVTSLIFKSSHTTIPADTRSITVALNMIRHNFTYNDAYSDNLSLVLSSTLGKKGRIAGNVRNDLDGNGQLDNGEGALKSIQIFLDKNNNGKLDRGEYSVTSDSKGQYAFENLSPGNYDVRTVVPAQFRATTSNPQTLTVSAGLTRHSNILLSQTSVITGVAWIDQNDNGKRDASESVHDGVTLFLDLNDNDELDSFDFTDTTNSKGVYRFVVPHGKYIVKRVNFTRPLPSAPSGQTVLNVTTARGQIKSADFQLLPE